jgi:hypothetical protein
VQGIKWIKNREAAAGLVIVQQSQPKYIDKVIHCIENGIPLLFENLPVDIDAGAWVVCMEGLAPYILLLHIMQVAQSPGDCS